MLDRFMPSDFLHAVVKKPPLAHLILAVILAGAASFYLASLTPSTFGLYHDDGLYAVMAKAIATNQGYRIVSLPTEPLQTKAPPFYPLLLSLIWRAEPDFPGNLWAMMLLSVLATLICLILIWLYLTKQGYASKWQALIVVGLVAMNWRTAVLATGLYSEMFYTALSIAGLHLAEEYEKRSRGWILGTALGVMTGLAFLTRSAGIVLLIAVVLYFILRRQVRKMLLPLAVGSCFVLSWIGWGYVNRPTGYGVNTAYYESYLRTLGEVVSDLEKQNNVSRLTAILSIIGKNVLMTVVVSVPLLCLGLDYEWPKDFGGFAVLTGICLLVLTLVLCVTGFLRRHSSGFRLLHIYLVLYLALHLVWPYSGYDRFLMPLLPFLLLFVTNELERLLRLVKGEWGPSGKFLNKISAAFVALIVLLLIGFAGYGYGKGLNNLLSSFKERAVSRAAEDAEAIRWINENTDVSDILVCYRDPSYYLYTGRKATRSSSLKEGGKMQSDPIDLSERSEDIFRIINENKATYLVFTSSDLELEHQADPYQKVYRTLLEQYPKVFVPVFEPPSGRCTVYRIYSDAR